MSECTILCLLKRLVAFTFSIRAFVSVFLSCHSIGDRIATSNPKTDTSPNGSSTWYVDKVTLFTTTVRFATTNEVATYSNGSLAVLRIINANRSPKAIISVLVCSLLI